MSKTWYIYCHTAPNGKRYVGQTCQKPSARWGRGRGYKDQPHFMRAIKKHGWDNMKHDVLCSVSTKKMADFLEQWFIEKYDTTNPDHGYNHTKGGGGTLGKKMSQYNREKLKEANTGRAWTDEQKRRQSERMKYLYDSGIIAKQPMSDEQRAKLSKDRKGAGNPMFGRHHSAEVCKRMSNSRKGMRRNDEQRKRISESRYKSSRIKRCPVYQFSMDGVLIASFSSIREAQDQTGFTSTSISACCRGKYKQAYGFIWCYQDKPETFPSPARGFFLSEGG